MKWTLGALLVALICTSVQAELITERPEIAHRKWYLTVVYSGDWSETDRALKQAVDQHPVLTKLRDQVVFNEYTNDSALIKDTVWKEYLGNARPAFLLQSQHRSDGTGHVVFFGAGEVLGDIDTLVEQCTAAVKAYAERAKEKGQRRPWRPFICPDGRCPTPGPQPRPNPKTPPEKDPPPPPKADPLVPDSDPLAPDLGPDLKAPGVDLSLNTKSTDDPVGFSALWLLLPLAAGAAGVYHELKRNG